MELKFVQDDLGLFTQVLTLSLPYLILVANATNGFSVKVKREEFFDNERKISHTVFTFTHSV